MMRRSVDLPEPDRPSRATISPVFRLIETSLSTGARLSPDPVWKTWVTLSTLKSVAIAGSNMANSSTNDGLRGAAGAPSRRKAGARTSD